MAARGGVSNLEQQKRNIIMIAQLYKSKLAIEKCEESLRAFVEEAWKVVEPGVPFVKGWHIDAICLPPGALVETREGPRRIVDMREYRGEVLTQGSSGGLEWRSVRAWMQSKGKPLLSIKCDSGESVEVTDNHPVYVSGKGYVRADEIRVGDTLQALREAVLSQSVSAGRSLLRRGVLQPSAVRTRENEVFGMRNAEVLGRVQVPEVLGEVPVEWDAVQVSAMREGSLSVPSEYAGDSQNFRMFLQPEMFRGLCDGAEQSSVFQREIPGGVPLGVRGSPGQDIEQREVLVLPLLGSWDAPRGNWCAANARRTPCGPGYQEQRFSESGGVVQEVSPEAGEWGSGGAVVVSIDRALRTPEFVYNIETDTNHNYFANGVLVHNCEHLEAVANREIQQLLINMPPRHMKSTLVSVMFPVWRWIKHPEEQFLFASYSESLSLRDSRKCRNLIRSGWFQKNWGSRFSLMPDQNEKRRFENDKMGYRLATSVGGTNTGEGGSIVLYDDPNSMKEINSDLIREGANDWHDQTMSSRLNDPKTSCRVCVQQRGHQHDMTGHLLELGGWEQLVLPARYEGESKTTSIGWSDPRTHSGELLWPERFGPKEMDELEHIMGAQTAAGQLQQRPSPSAGSIFERGWWNYWNPRGVQTGPVVVKNPGQEVIQKTPVEIPLAFEQVVQSWDLAFKDLAHNDFVAGHTWGRIGANVYLLARVKERLDFTKTLRAIRTMSEHFPCPEKLVEDKANGPAVIATLKNEIPGMIAVTPEGGKESRAQAVSPYVEAGNVYLPNPDLFPWVKEFVEEYAFFPRGAHDDDVDAGTQALRRLFDSVSQSALPEFRVMPRAAEPDSACHIKPAEEMNAEIQPHWRRWIAVSPGALGAALWFCETPRGALRVYRELDLSGVDAHEAGRMIATASLPDIRAYMRSVHSTAKWNIDVLMGSEAFRPIEPIGSYAELMEQGLLSYEPTTGDFDDRQAVQAELRLAKFSTQMAEVEDAAFDRLRELLRFKPVDFETVEFDRAKSIQLARQDINLYQAYMAAVDGQVHGEWPKIKFSSELPRTVASVGAAKREKDITDPFLNALVIGVCAPKSVMSAKPMRETLYNPHQMQQNRPRLRRAG